MSVLLTLYLLLLLALHSASGRRLTIVVGVNEASHGAKEGVREAVDEWINATDSEILVKEIVVSSAPDPETVCRQVFAENSSAPHLFIDATTTPNEAIPRMVRAMGLPTISANPLADGWSNLTEEEERYLIHFKSPVTLMVQSVNDIIDHYNYKETTVFYDNSFGDLLPDVNSSFPTSLVDTVEGLTHRDWYKKLRRVRRRMKRRTFFVLGSMVTINTLTEAINDPDVDMFRSAYTWYFVMKENKRVRCLSCKHANMFTVKPRPCHLHDYEGNRSLPFSRGEDRVNSYFYYDLTRMLLRAINQSNRSSLSYPKCGATGMTSDQRKERKEVALNGLLFKEAQGFHGKYGEYFVGTNTEVEQVSRTNYQDIWLEIQKIKYLYDKRRQSVESRWYFGEPSGAVISKSYLGEEDETDRDDFDGITFLVIHHPPFVFKSTVPSNKTVDEEKKKDPEGEDDKVAVPVYRYTGFMIDLKNEIMNRFEKKYPGEFPAKTRVVESSDFNIGGWGGTLLPKAGKSEEEATASIIGGLVAEIGPKEEEESKNVKVVLLPMTITAERLEYIDFTYPFFESVGIKVLTKKPLMNYHFSKFVSVFEWSVWLCIIGAYFFTSIAVHLFDKNSPMSYRNNPAKYGDTKETRIFTLKESLWFCILSLTPQGGGEAPKAVSGRLVSATWWLFGFIVIASYTANLSAFLTVNRLDNRPIQLHNGPAGRGLSRQYKTKYAPFAWSSTQTYFERMGKVEELFYEVWKNLSLDDSLNEDDRAMLAVWDYPIGDHYTKMWAQMVEAKSFKGYVDAITKVKSTDPKTRKGYALVAEAPVIDYAVRTNCDLMTIGNEFTSKPNAIGIPKRWKFKERWNEIIKELIDEGWIDRKRDEWWYEKFPEKVCNEWRLLSDGLTLKSVGGVLLVICVGLVATAIGTYIENWYFNEKVGWDALRDRNRALFRGTDQVALPITGWKRCTIQ